MAWSQSPIAGQGHDHVAVAVVGAADRGAFGVLQLQRKGLLGIEHLEKIAEEAGIERDADLLAVVGDGNSTRDWPTSAARPDNSTLPSPNVKSTPRLSSLVTIAACRTAAWKRTDDQVDLLAAALRETRPASLGKRPSTSRE